MLLVEPVAVAHSPTLSVPAVTRLGLGVLGRLGDVHRLRPRSWWWPCPFENETVTASHRYLRTGLRGHLARSGSEVGRPGDGARTRPVVRAGDVPRRETGSRRPAATAAAEARWCIRPWWRQIAPRWWRRRSRRSLWCRWPRCTCPLRRRSRSTETVAVMMVLELRLTVVWPLSALWTSRMLPVTLAILPDAAGRNAAGGPPELPSRRRLRLCWPPPGPSSQRRRG